MIIGWCFATVNNYFCGELMFGNTEWFLKRPMMMLLVKVRDLDELQ